MNGTSRMPQSLPTAEILSDAKAYASVGDTDNAIAILLEGLTARASYEDELAIHTMLDSFAGLSVPGEKDAIDWSSEEAEHLSLNMRSGQYAFPLNLVQGNVHRLFPQVELHVGWIPQVFSAQPERAYRFVHIDVDLYQPTIDSLDYFFPRLSEGGIVITDDYSWPGARKAFDEFSVRNALELHATDTGQAFFVKERSN